MKRFTPVVFGVLVLALSMATAAAAAAGGSYGPWQPTYQGPISVAAGVVCPFAVTAEPVREDLAFRYHYDESGSVDGYEVKGPLIARITNVDTGASTVRNLSGLGSVTFNADGSYDAVVEGGFLLFMTSADTPANELLFLSGRTVLHGSPSGAKTVVAHSGSEEDVCVTLG